MKKIFLTSNLNHYHKIANKKIANEINNTNGLVGQLKKTINRFDTIVYIASNPSDIEKVFAQSDILKIFNFNMCDKNKGSKIVTMYAIIVFDFENKYLEEM